MAPVGQYLRIARSFSERSSARILALTASLDATRPAGVREIYPGPGSVYVEWDDAVLPAVTAGRWIDGAIAHPEPGPGESRLVEVPTRYGALDTEEVSAATGLAAERIVELHTGAEFRVCSTATAGQPILGGSPEQLELPRRAVPRGDVPARSVAVAGRFTTIYPMLLPGGWNVIGTALSNVFNPNRDDPFTFHLGDRVRFVASEAPDPAKPGRRLLLPDEPRLPALRVDEAGPLDLVLDAGRLNQSHHGLAQSGFLDAPAARLANALCGNPPGAPCVESTLSGPTLVALRDLVVGVAGEGMRLELDGAPVGCETVPVRAGSRLRVRPSGSGVRGYLAVAGGIEADLAFGSASVDRHGLLGRELQAGDVLGVAREVTPQLRMQAVPRGRPQPTTLRLHRGPQWSPDAERALNEGTFTVTTGDRMGVRFSGPAIPGGELLSESPPPGAVQVPPNGDPIILLADRMRSAGYDKPAVVHPHDLAVAAQLRTGDAVRFAVVGDHPVPWERDLT